jgi:hypothetical protein
MTESLAYVELFGRLSSPLWFSSLITELEARLQSPPMRMTDEAYNFQK